jgi:hypothetical protein
MQEETDFIMENLLVYTIYTFVMICFILVALVGWDFTHGG